MMFTRATHLHQRLSALIALIVFAVALPLAGCGSSGSSSSTAASTPPATSSTTASTTAAKASCGSSVTPASSEAASTAQGDIPDNQQFLQFKNAAGGYSISYPEGWARSGTGPDVTFRDKDNTIHITVQPGSSPTPASVRSQLEQQAASDPCIKTGQSPQSVTVGPNQAVKVTYTTLGPKDPVTGKRLAVTVDRYVYSKGGKVATADLGNPTGVDNVDAFRMISESFRWG
jgi:hypothetical protein